jgi:putative addiction module component (TIGR02574 family)
LMGRSEKGTIDRSGREFDWRYGMKPESEELLREALKLPPVERAILVDQLLTSLDTPDDAIDKSWRKEIAARLRVYRAGTAATVSAEDILAEHRAK